VAQRRRFVPCAVSGADMGDGMGGCTLPLRGSGGLPWEILKILMKMGALWCNLENVLYPTST